MSTTEQQIASLLLNIEAVKLSPQKPFVWSSGWHSPIYCDNRISLSFPEARTIIKNALVEAIRINFPDVQAIAGVATAGIAQGVLVADLMQLPNIYVRPEPKKHGMGNQIEGRLVPNQKVVVIEDLVSTGGSSLKAVDALREAGAEVLGMVAIFSYGFEVASENFKQKNVSLVCLSNYEVLIKEALRHDYVNREQIETLSEWRKNPATWGEPLASN
jgi:orotate phosphoribosyltransferase